MKKNNRSKLRVAIIMGSQSDYAKMRDAEKILREFGVEFETLIVSAHRTPQWMYDFASRAEENNFAVIIAAAGGAAHLPGMVASLTTLPVIGVPILVGKLNGLDALLSIAQMPRGVPVATVAVDNSTNAGLLAVRILSVQDLSLRARLKQYSAKVRRKVLKNKKIVKK